MQRLAEEYGEYGAGMQPPGTADAGRRVARRVGGLPGELASDQRSGKDTEVEMRLRMRGEGNEEEEATIYVPCPDKADLSSYTTLVALPNELRKLNQQVREITVLSTALDTLPEWLRELARLEVLHVGGADDLRACPLRAVPESLGALTALQTYDFSL